MEQLKVEIRDVTFKDKTTGKERTFKGVFLILPAPYGLKTVAVAVKAVNDQGYAMINSYINSL